MNVEETTLQETLTATTEETPVAPEATMATAENVTECAIDLAVADEVAATDTTEQSATEESPAVEATAEETKEAAPAYTPKTFDIDIDFDSYTVSEKRAESIRALLVNIKEKTWLASLKDWVEAEGQAHYPYGEQTEMGEAPGKRIAWEAEHTLQQLEIINDGVDTEIRIEGKRYVSLQKLPKGDELLLSHFNPEMSTKFAEIEVELHANLKVFLKAKADKQKAFQEKFKK
jgi:hypothetical protein